VNTGLAKARRQDMHVGFLFNCSMTTNPRVRLSPAVINRALLIDAVLRQFDSRVFYYSPKHIRSVGEQVPGYVIEGHDFVPSRSHIPLVNGNWTYNTRALMNQGMGFQNFAQWADEHQVGVYVPLAFSELVANKYEAYKLVRGYRDDLHPHTEPYRHSLDQLGHFLDRNDSIFIKPRAGNKGNRILTLRRSSSGYMLKRYHNGVRQQNSFDDLAAASNAIRDYTHGSRRFIIQSGINTLRYDGSVFDIRVVMMFDGREWDWIHEVRLSPQGSDISNVSQGGICVATEDFLLMLLGSETAQKVLADLRSDSFGLAAYLDKLHPGELMELAFDFVVDSNQSPRLVEINTKPGLANVGFSNSVIDMPADLEPQFKRWVYPHTGSLARFLQSKVEAL